MNRLTPAEEQVMLKLWSLKKATIHELLDLYELPKPSYNTVSTIVRILVKKKYIKHRSQGNKFIYRPSILKEEYSDYLIDYLIQNYFNRSKNNLISSITKKNSLNDLL
jgi:BlaI family transcriptional regulator, penicillinase repressor